MHANHAVRARGKAFLGASLGAAMLLHCATSRAGEGFSTRLGGAFAAPSEPPASDVLALTGAALFLEAYGDSVVAAVFSHRDTDRDLFVPAAGPWLDLAQRRCDVTPCGAAWLSGALLVVDGAAQDLGVALMAASLFVPNGPLRVGADEARVRVLAASVGRGGYGLEVAGAF